MMMSAAQVFQNENFSAQMVDRSEPAMSFGSISKARPKVLVVDDEPEIAEETAEMLVSAGHQCVVVSDYCKALDAVCADQDISILITDVKMPGMNGLEMVRTMNAAKASERDLEVIMISGQSGSNEVIEALRVGAMDFLAKPVSPDHLLQVVRSAAERIQSRQQERDLRAQLEHVALQSTAQIEVLSDNLLRANREVLVSGRVKSEFLSLVSHELRTPLNAVIGFSDIITMSAKKDADSRDREYVELISMAGHDLLRSLNTILDLVDVNGGDVELLREDVDVTDVVESVKEAFRPKAAAASIILKAKVEGSIPLVQTDHNRLTQAIGYLLDNAIRFSPENSRVFINLKMEQDELVVQVVDEGIGMTADEISLARDDFRQVEGIMARQVQGLGLGLTLAGKFIDLHGGSLEIESSPGVGTVVTMSLPIGASCHE